MPSMQDMLPAVKAYVDRRDWADVPAMHGRWFTVAPLAQGEYNLNYLLTAGSNDAQFVFRVNIGTQIDRPNQIEYEYRALKLLENSGVTPRPFFVDSRQEMLGRGVLIMEYLPGDPLDYTRDLESAARLFAIVHQIRVPEERNHLIREDAPLSLIFNECKGLLQHYFDSDLADRNIRSYLKEVILWADEARKQETFFQQDPWYCVINTEVNSGNFIVERKGGTIHLVDWEMPRWGDPSQDLAHFCSPLTTLWKTTYRMTPAAKARFIDVYSRGIRKAHLRESLPDRIKLRDPFVYLRGISWSAMGWVAYQSEHAGLKNPDTWQTLQRYMDLSFIRSLFDPFMRA
jgi:aminoglycoside phosphotransferase (APT) family kinase protein